MLATHMQRTLAFIFLGLGAWPLVFPGTVEALGLRPDYFVGNDTSRLLLQCFGAQAILVGIVILSSRFVPRDPLNKQFAEAICGGPSNSL